MEQVILDHTCTRADFLELLRKGGLDPETYDQLSKKSHAQLYMELKNRDAKLLLLENERFQGLVRFARSSKLLVHTSKGYLLEEGRLYEGKQPYLSTMPWTFSGCQKYPNPKEEKDLQKEENPLSAILRETFAEGKIRPPENEIVPITNFPEGTFHISKAFYGIWSAVLVSRFEWNTKRTLNRSLIRDKGVKIPVKYYRKIPTSVNENYLKTIREYDRVFGRISSYLQAP